MREPSGTEPFSTVALKVATDPLVTFTHVYSGVMRVPRPPSRPSRP